MRIIFFTLIFFPLFSCAMDELTKNNSLGYVIAFAKSDQLKAKARIVVQKFESNKKNIVYFHDILTMQKLIDPIKIALAIDINIVIANNDNSQSDTTITLDQLIARYENNQIINNLHSNFDKLINQFDAVEKISSRSCNIL